MKRVIAFLSAAALLCIPALGLASGSELTVDKLSLDKSSYSVGESATISFDYNVPYENVTSASASFTFEGLENVKLTAARTLVCDDSSCNMHNDASFLSFSGSKLSLGAGYSGAVTFTATVKNESTVKVKAVLKTNSDSVSESTSASVSDYNPPATPTPKPTSTPKTTSAPKTTAAPTPKNTPKPSSAASAPRSGGMSYAVFAVISILAGGAALVAGRRK